MAYTPSDLAEAAVVLPGPVVVLSLAAATRRGYGSVPDGNGQYYAPAPDRPAPAAEEPSGGDE
jgi:hypothetical protein